ncbi:DUF192 domain-containing protein [Leptobacterium flavescens]|uniref:DUF192 domain-containing protein n=1 Tax=Leptobacterium flavescens TaxID=472055 RepID=A0A6P0URZ2_9FLAO|nr:DUF192 domain-containing protein [Leptobacterium flavescens]NER15302.1 DUF192 domain-containing protein [Leptobacterium flavescens]
MHRLKKIALIVFTGAALMVSCKKDNKNTDIKPREISFKKEGELKLFKADGTLIKQLDIEIADNDYETETGLMHRTSMPDNQGMLFIFKDEQPRFFYMKNTVLPLDIIYINSANKVVSFIENAEPFNEDSLPSNEPAQYVLEVNAGLIKKWNIQVGDSIEFTRS